MPLVVRAQTVDALAKSVAVPSARRGETICAP